MYWSSQSLHMEWLITCVVIPSFVRNAPKVALYKEIWFSRNNEVMTPVSICDKFGWFKVKPF